jgi:hypothetical protein
MNFYNVIYTFSYKGELILRNMEATIKARDLDHARNIIRNRCLKCRTILQQITYLEERKRLI